MRKIPETKNLVIKIGSNILSDDKGLNVDIIYKIADAVTALKKRVPNITIVSSGAIAAGFKLLGFKKRPVEIIDKQASAAVGQSQLMRAYEDAFAFCGGHVAQILITKQDFSARSRYLNAQGTIERLLSLGVIPVINENDTVVVNELKYVESFGDNDNLGALVAGMLRADMLLILSDVDGLFTADPAANADAELLLEVNEISRQIIAMTGGSSSEVGTGGMRSKISAAQKALQYGCRVAIINGKEPNNIISFFNGEPIGTFFSKPSGCGTSKKLWIKYAAIPQGAVIVDDGACIAITDKHSSLLSSGITAVDGVFKKGDIIKIVDKDHIQIGVGKTRYSSYDINIIKQKNSSELSSLLGRNASAVVVHCDEIGLSK